MPISTEAPRCSEFARSIGVLPLGSGLFLDRVLLVTVPLPWPKPALKHELLQPLTEAVRLSDVRSRLFAAEPTTRSSPDSMADTSPLLLEIFERQANTTRLYRWSLQHVGELTQLVHAACAAPVGELATLEVGDHHVLAHTAEPAPTFLVCTQGSHDSCCGTSGVALADEIERERPDYVVRRVSHTGGHRFSPTFLAFPEGRMWAFADLALVDRIAQNALTEDDVLGHSRGWWGAKVGPAQVAESVLRSTVLHQPFEEPTIIPVASLNDDEFVFDVTSRTDAQRVHVRVGRQIPSIACESPGGMPAKPGREFAWSVGEKGATVSS